FWTEDMSQVDWQTVYHRYYALIERVSTRGEFSDLMWEMQGELGTSHAYEFGGDYRPRPYYGQGFLGAHFSWAPEAGGYRIDEIILGDPWDPKANSPLAAPGVDVQVGDVLLAINGQPLGPEVSPSQLLVNQAGNEVLLTLAPRPQDGAGGSNGEGPEASRTGNRLVIVRALESEVSARYRRWVEQNRRYVHEATDGRAGYVHIPDMSPRGYAEFHRGFLAEIERDGLIVDVRYN
ncbi:peptidase S41, partial [Litorilinea aerophila]